VSLLRVQGNWCLRVSSAYEFQRPEWRIVRHRGQVRWARRSLEHQLQEGEVEEGVLHRSQEVAAAAAEEADLHSQKEEVVVEEVVEVDPHC
jgi:hypothetical protein